jgi:hypothetical protein
MHEMIVQCSEPEAWPTLLTAEGPLRRDGTRLTATLTPPPSNCA